MATGNQRTAPLGCGSGRHEGMMHSLHGTERLLHCWAVYRGIPCNGNIILTFHLSNIFTGLKMFAYYSNLLHLFAALYFF